MGTDLIATSMDGGETWREAKTGGAGAYKDVAFDGTGNGVAVGGSSVNFFTFAFSYTMDGGERWQAVTAAVDRPLATVAHAAGTWSALGLSDTTGQLTAFHTNDPALLWSETPIDAPVGGGFSAMAHGDAMWVAVGWSVMPVHTSVDGKSWTAGTQPGPFNAVAYGNGKWVATRPSGEVWYTNDPTGKWTRASTPAVGQLHDVAYGSGTWIAVGAGGQTLRATDLAGPWTAIWSNTNHPVRGVAHDARTRRWGAVGGSAGTNGASVALYSTDDGRSWMQGELWAAAKKVQLRALAIAAQ